MAFFAVVFTSPFLISLRLHPSTCDTFIDVDTDHVGMAGVGWRAVPTGRGRLQGVHGDVAQRAGLDARSREPTYKCMWFLFSLPAAPRRDLRAFEALGIPIASSRRPACYSCSSSRRHSRNKSNTANDGLHHTP